MDLKMSFVVTQWGVPTANGSREVNPGEREAGLRFTAKVALRHTRQMLLG